MDGNVSPKIHVLKPLTPNVIVFEDKDYKAVIKVKCHKDEALIQ